MCIQKRLSKTKFHSEKKKNIGHLAETRSCFLWVKNMQTAGYDGAGTVCTLKIISIEMADSPMNWQILLNMADSAES